jgi:hypothetical protein
MSKSAFVLDVTTKNWGLQLWAYHQRILNDIDTDSLAALRRISVGRLIQLCFIGLDRMLIVRRRLLGRLFFHDGERFGSFSDSGDPRSYDYKKKFGGKIGYPTEYKKPSNFPRGVSATADQTQSELVALSKDGHIGPPVSTKTLTGIQAPGQVTGNTPYYYICGLRRHRHRIK